MARQKRRSKAPKEPPWPKGDIDHLAWLDIPADMLEEWRRARKAMEPFMRKLNARMQRESRGLPSTRKEQQEDFDRLGVPANVYKTLWEWGATPKTVEPVLRFLKRVKFWRGAQEADIYLGRRVYGRAREAHFDPHPEEPGELTKLNRAVDLLRSAIRLAFFTHSETCDAIYDHRIEMAAPHMTAVLKAIEEGWVDVDPTLPVRKPGQKPGLRMPLHEGEAPERVKRKDVERTLKSLLLPLHPRKSKPEVKNLSRKLLDPILQ